MLLQGADLLQPVYAQITFRMDAADLAYRFFRVQLRREFRLRAGECNILLPAAQHVLHGARCAAVQPERIAASVVVQINGPRERDTPLI